MANQLESAITIKEALKKIDKGEFLLPAIQRRFVWNTEQIEILFDSMMQGYPINTFMFWAVEDKEIKDSFLFYNFLKKYIEYEGGNNPLQNTKGDYDNFYAVIDGQQRLNSIYIALKGTYAYKNYRYRAKKYNYDEKDYPTRKLYLDILSPLENDEERKVYDFRFLVSNIHEQEYLQTEKEIEDTDGKKKKVPCFWFEVGEILNLKFKDDFSVMEYVNEQERLKGNRFAGRTLVDLYKLMNAPLINYYLEKDQSFDKILYEFIRTNSGGTKLSFADLLMSIITAAWDDKTTHGGARGQIDGLVKDIRSYGFEVNQDFILKTCLVVLSNDVKFSLSNFNNETVGKIKNNWSKLTLTIKASFELLKSLKFNEESLRSKNAVIPIIYYLYTSDKYKEINKDIKYHEDKRAIKKYLHIVLLNKLFGGSTDGFLKALRGLIQSSTENIFPFLTIKEAFKGTNKSFNISDERLDEILKTNYEEVDSFYLLALLFPDFDFNFKNPNIDHLHPKASFDAKNLDFLDNMEDRVFYLENFNTITNLAFLSEELNKSKNDSALKPWLEKQEVFEPNFREKVLIPEKVDCDLLNFKEFIEKRQVLLKERIRNNIN